MQSSVIIMKKQTALTIILIISIAGLLFSGYLTYGELFAKTCYATSLGMGPCTNVARLPACVYGFFMYLIIFVICLFGIKSRN
jgi:hypothetical protein